MLARSGFNTNIARQLQQVIVPFHQDSFVTALEHMPYPLMGAVEALGVYAVELPHPLRKVCLRCFNQKMVVVGHLAPGVAHPVKTFTGLPEHLQPCRPVLISEKNILTAIAPRCDVVDAAGQFNSEWTRHEVRL